ncbi:RhuM family protein [Leptotrichia sp. oral taxon 212]|jgi:toxin-antitoxin system, toxin component, fic domain protein|uniref:RhuM family protein n=1 Tax=Leptotrichia sp. oral taxon 212 TaxID=712357 RepID=UPI0009FA830E|nr:RhuM family protein [Leptotrichia sp. oral taxon 212]
MNNEVILYKDGELELPVEVAPDRETVWLNRNQLVVLFDRDVKTIGKHINNALKEELDSSVVAKFATTASDGKTYKVDYYNLDMIISVGYRVKSPRGIAFRKWATLYCFLLFSLDMSINIILYKWHKIKVFIIRFSLII